jgi:hypothetical protein
VKKIINLWGIIVVSAILCLTQASCIVFGGLDTSRPHLKIVNNYDLPINAVGMNFIENVSPDYSFIDINITKGKSETFPLESYHEPYSAEVIVYFGGMYSYKELRFETGVITTATLNVNGILE